MNPKKYWTKKIFHAFALTIVATGVLAQYKAAGQPTQCIETNGQKYIQPPEVDGGWDVMDRGQIVLADDFPCSTTGPISDIHIWGSWLSDNVGVITNFWIAIYDDVPASTPNNPYSHPGTNLLWSQFFGAGQFTAQQVAIGSELFFDPSTTNILGTDTAVWYYCFYPTNPFPQQGTTAKPTNYWLVVHAQQGDATGQQRYGWKTSLAHYNDAAVWGNFIGGSPVGNWKPMLNFNNQRLDLSFKITTATNTPQECAETNGTKYVQWPNLHGGMDVWANGPNGPWVLADDFLCTTEGQITDIHIWGSYLQDRTDPNLTFWLAIYDDVPAGPTGFSHPGNLLWQEQFGPGRYIQTLWGIGDEFFLDPGPPNILGPDTNVWYYCFYPTNAFKQTGGPLAPKIYWLMVRAESPLTTTFWGWKTTTNVQRDISVHANWPGAPPPGGFAGWTPTYQFTGNQNPLDLSFKITTADNPPQGCVETNGTKYVQWPNLQGGLDVWDNGPNGPWVLADDFICMTNGPITDIHVWGSYLRDQTYTNLSFWLAIYDDVPQGPGNPFSHPGNLLWQEQFGPGRYIQSFWGIGDELFLDPGPPNILGPDTNVWYYCFYPTNIFRQTGSPFAPKTYWLMVRADATPSTTTFWGWKTTTNVQHDISVHAQWPGAPPLGGWAPTYQFTGNQNPLDLSFKITTGTNQPQDCVETNGVKYVQWPNMIGGYDVWNNGPPAAPWVLADDFVCTNPGPVSDIHIWGSWLNDSVGALPTFWLSIYDDVPVSPTNNFSHPGKLQWQQYFGPGDYIQTFWGFGQESFLNPGPPQVMGPDSQVWYYCFYPTNAFIQQGTLTAPQIYWLVATVRSPAGDTNLYGWKTTTNVQHDISVHTPWTGLPPDPSTPWQPTRPSPTGGSLDLAFKITTRTNCITPIICSADKSVECGSPWTFDPPIVGPNPCCANAPIVTQLGVFTNVNNPCNALLSSVWRITDCVGTLAYCTQYVTVKDTTPPIITCATNKTVECGTSWVFDLPTATDNCCGTNLTFRLTSTNATVLGPCQTIWRGVWQASDCCTNLSLLCTQLVTVVDTKPPQLTCPTNMTVTTCGTNVQVFWSVTATDVCNSVTITSSPPSGTFFLPNTTNTVTVQASDPCTNLTTCAFTVTVRRPVLGSLVINLINTNTMVQVHWTDGILTHSTNVLGPYIDIPGASPPTYTTSVTNATRFYRLRCNSP